MEEKKGFGDIYNSTGNADDVKTDVTEEVDSAEFVDQENLNDYDNNADAVFICTWHGYSCADAARNGYLHSESRQKGNPFDGGACSFDNFGNSLHTSYQD